MQSYVKLALVLQLEYKAGLNQSQAVGAHLFPRSSTSLTANMVKFTFASVSLIVASLSAAVSAAPTTFALYNITSFQTNFALLSDGTETVGSDVSTVQASSGTPSTTVWALVVIFLVTELRMLNDRRSQSSNTVMRSSTRLVCKARLDFMFQLRLQVGIHLIRLRHS